MLHSAYRFFYSLTFSVSILAVTLGCSTKTVNSKPTYPVKKIVMFWNGVPPIVILDIPPAPLSKEARANPSSLEANYYRDAKHSYSNSYYAGELLSSGSRVTTRVILSEPQLPRVT